MRSTRTDNIISEDAPPETTISLNPTLTKRMRRSTQPQPSGNVLPSNTGGFSVGDATIGGLPRAAMPIDNIKSTRKSRKRR